MELVAIRALKFNKARTTSKFHLLLCVVYQLVAGNIGYSKEENLNRF